MQNNSHLASQPPTTPQNSTAMYNATCECLTAGFERCRRIDTYIHCGGTFNGLRGLLVLDASRRLNTRSLRSSFQPVILGQSIKRPAEAVRIGEQSRPPDEMDDCVSAERKNVCTDNLCFSLKSLSFLLVLILVHLFL